MGYAQLPQVCPICRLPARVTDSGASEEFVLVERIPGGCSCGVYEPSGRFGIGAQSWRTEDPGLFMRLPLYIQEENKQGKTPRITDENWRALAAMVWPE